MIVPVKLSLHSMASLSWCLIYLLLQSHLQATYLCCKFWLPAQSLAITLWLLPHPSTETDLVKITDAFCRQHYPQWTLKVHTFLDPFSLLKLTFHAASVVPCSSGFPTSPPSVHTRLPGVTS